MEAITHWWKKYMVLREIKKEYEAEREKCKKNNTPLLFSPVIRLLYLERLLEAIK